MGQVKFVEDRQALKNYTWSILEYFAPKKYFQILLALILEVMVGFLLFFPKHGTMQPFFLFLSTN